MAEVKTCGKCGEDKPLGDFLASNGDARKTCKKCRGPWRGINIKPVLTSKRCKTCGKTKVISEFTSGVTKHGERYTNSKCKKCAADTAKEYRARNPGKAAAYSRDYARKNAEALAEKRIADRETKRAYDKEYRKKNSARKKRYMEERRAYFTACRKVHYEKNRDRIRKRNSDYTKANRARYNLINATRKIKLKQATPAWADKEKMRQIYLDAKREEERTRQKIHVDHIVPLNSDLVCGLHWEGNLRLMYAKDNISKGNRTWPDMPEPNYV